MTLTDNSADRRFLHHVSFDTFAGGESTTEKNTLAFTLNVKHQGYQFKRRSRTFMVGISENEYSEIALQWMLDELVDDGDEIICVRVIDKDSKVISDRNVEKRQYQTEAKELLERIQIKNDEKAVSIVLEFVAGKLHATFQRMIQIYEPALLIVGTKGRSLGGIQGLMANRNSFSKWCLQHSPIPVVVVRPTDKRMKKKKKRIADPGRHDYARILRDSGIKKHETDITSQNSSIWEISNDPEVEAHAVAAALGLPAGFSHTSLPAYVGGGYVPCIKVESENTDHGSLPLESPSGSLKTSETQKLPLNPTTESGDQDHDHTDELQAEMSEFEAIPGTFLLAGPEVKGTSAQRSRIHDRKLDESTALAPKKHGSVCSTDSAEYESGEESSEG